MRPSRLGVQVCVWGGWVEGNIWESFKRVNVLNTYRSHQIFYFFLDLFCFLFLEICPFHLNFLIPWHKMFIISFDCHCNTYQLCSAIPFFTPCHWYCVLSFFLSQSWHECIDVLNFFGEASSGFVEPLCCLFSLYFIDFCSLLFHLFYFLCCKCAVLFLPSWYGCLAPFPFSLSPFLIYTLKGLNLLVSTALAVSHKFGI